MALDIDAARKAHWETIRDTPAGAALGAALDELERVRHRASVLATSADGYRQDVPINRESQVQCVSDISLRDAIRAWVAAQPETVAPWVRDKYQEGAA